MIDDSNNLKIAELEREIALLPGGSMAKKIYAARIIIITA